LSEWRTPPDELRLAVGQAHVWQLRTDVSDSVLLQLTRRLPRHERDRAERIRHPAVRRGFVVARAWLRALLASYLGDARELELRYSPYGKPELEGPAGVAVRFSIAHSGGVAMLAYSGIDVGVDVERIRPVARASRIAERVFSPATREVLASVDPSDRWPAFFAAWTQREALVKAVGGGMLATADPLDFVWPPASSPRRCVEPKRIWTVARLPVDSPFVAVLVGAGPLDEILLWTPD